jgi:hypothetical protein
VGCVRAAFPPEHTPASPQSTEKMQNGELCWKK